MNRFWSTAVAALLVIATPVSSKDTEPQTQIRTITVMASGEVKVKPDYVVVTLGVMVFNPELTKARTDADAKIKNVLALMPKFKIDEKDFRTEYLEITPQYKMEDDHERHDQLLGYEVSNSIGVTLRDLGQLEGLVAAAFDAGANTISGISFETTEIRKHQDDARKSAIRTAREKASLMAKELGQDIGKARTITEGGSEYSGRTSRFLGGSGGGGGGLFGGGGTPSASTIVAGEITVISTVSVVFDLE